jgi:hypothetical protein
MTTNPFEVLRLDPASTEEEVVRQAGRLRQRAPDETTMNAIRQAVQALTASEDERALHALLTHPRPCYQWPALEKLSAAYRHPPEVASQPLACPPLDLEECRQLLLAMLVEELEFRPLPFNLPAVAEGPAEIQRQTAEALWQSLLSDMRA